MESVSTGRRLNPRSESIDHFRTCREDFGIERNQSFKGDQGNAQFSLCCTSTAMPDDDPQGRHPAFLLFMQNQEIYGRGLAATSPAAKRAPQQAANVHHVSPEYT